MNWRRKRAEQRQKGSVDIEAAAAAALVPMCNHH